MGIWISYAAFDISTLEVVTYWSRDYVTISFMWIFELTNDICITYCDIYLPRSCLFSLFGHLIWLWISELRKKNIWFIIVDIWPGKPILQILSEAVVARGGGGAFVPKYFLSKFDNFSIEMAKFFYFTHFLSPPKKSCSSPPPPDDGGAATGQKYNVSKLVNKWNIKCILIWG